MTDAIHQPLHVAGEPIRRVSGWWGMWMLIATEASLFAYLLFAYGYLAVLNGDAWPRERPEMKIALCGTALLLASSGVFALAERACKAGRRPLLLLSLAALMGVVFIALQAIEWRHREYSLADGAYASSYFVTTGFHMAHVVGGLLMIAALWWWVWLGLVDARRPAAFTIVGMYWHFVDAVWLAVFAAYYVWPLLR